MPKKILLGIDTGGTFTDFVLWYEQQIRIHKVLSTPSAPEQAILQGIHELGLPATADEFTCYIVHGSTVATNAVLEGKGVRTVYITNRGLRDVLTIGRQARQELYNLQPAPVVPPVPRE
ncbi:MAG: hydantoinase/oxoprolinase N-terminal domain-containing protein, partial [Gammaproteobacteria bacterium]